MTFIERLQEWIQETGIMQKDIAEGAGVDTSYISSVVHGRKALSPKLINWLSEKSGKSDNWWLYGKEIYDNLDSLNMIVNTFIDMGQIKEGVEIRQEIKDILMKMLEKEIADKFEQKKSQH